MEGSSPDNGATLFLWAFKWQATIYLIAWERLTSPTGKTLAVPYTAGAASCRD